MLEVPVANPKAEYLRLKTEIDAALAHVLEQGRLILGPEVEAFEQEFAAYCETSDAIGVANATDGLALVLRGLGIGQGDEVVTVGHTAVATVAAIEMAGATPVLIDVDLHTRTMDPTRLGEALTKRSRAVIPVHLYGVPADLRAIGDFCAQHGLALIEDCSQAHGARWDGARVGSFGIAGVFSCYPTKNLGAVGDAGVVVTSDDSLADRIRSLRQYGWRVRNRSELAGVNSRLDEIQAAVLRVKLRHLDWGNESRRRLAASYGSQLRGVPGVSLPLEPLSAEAVYHLFVLEVQDRQALRHKLAQFGIATAVHYPIPVHRQPAYQGRIACSGDMRSTEFLADHVLTIPMFPDLSETQIKHVCAAVLSTADSFVGGGPWSD